MEWKYCKKLSGTDRLDEIEFKLEIVLPQEYKKIVSSCNGGRPSANIYDTKTEKERMIKRFLPIGEEFEHHFLYVYNIIKGDLKGKVIPFADDPAGNYICFDYRKVGDGPNIVLWNHETNNFEEIRASFVAFMDSLYELT